MKRFLCAVSLSVTLFIAGGCSFGESGASDSFDVPSYVKHSAEFSETLSVGHISINYPNELESMFVDSFERISEDGGSCIATVGQAYNEDWSLVVTVEEYSGCSIDEALAEVEDEMSLPERYEELDDATKAVVDHTKWVSLEEADGGFVLTKTYDDAMLAAIRYVEISEVDHARIVISMPLSWDEFNPDFVDSLLASVVVNDEAAGFPGGIWIPTEIDPVYVDDKGVTWGYQYHPEGEPDHVMVFPDMLYTQGDDGAIGYLNMAEHELAILAAENTPPDEPGEYAIEITSNLYGFLSNEVIGTHTSKTFASQPAETPEESANEWVPTDESISVTDDGRTWGWWTASGSTDMEFVMSSDTGRYGYIVAADRIKAESDNWNAFMSGTQDPTVMLDVFLYNSDEVVGRYAVTLFTS